jgi:hypothetical protein
MVRVLFAVATIDSGLSTGMEPAIGYVDAIMRGTPEAATPSSY